MSSVEMNWIEHPDFETLVETVAGELAQLCRDALSARDVARLALAGGSTPLPVYRRLARAGLDWGRVVLMPGDERWVAADDPASNLRALSECFESTGARIAGLVPDSPGPEPELATARAALAQVGLPLDACVLGMGGDGHFASLFPGAPGLSAALDPASTDPLAIIAPNPLPPEAPYRRVSLTLSAIAASHRILLLLRGRAKRDTLETALDVGDAERFPIAALLAQPQLPLAIHWSP